MSDQKQSSVVQPIRFHEDLDYRAGDVVRQQILDAFDQGEVVCDVSSVLRVSTPGVQLFLSVAATAESHDLSFRIAGNSAALNDAIVSLGLQEHFQKWMNIE